ncbi:FimD/PapC N-terminal domain-containing protein [Pseudomonas allii]|nr:FimD/PapC N-terminal domain-containing protein [Pseudomonas allii]
MLAGLISAALTSIEHVTAAEPVFDLQAFSSEGAAVDVSRFSRYDLISPGTHLMEIIVNGQPMGRREVTFMTPDAQADAVPCVDRDLLLQLGVAPERIGTLLTASECPALEDWLPAATSRVDAAALEWAVSLPQVYVKQLPRGFIDPSYWDEGIDAGLLNYTFSTTRMTAGAGTDRAYLGLNAGLNLGRWRCGTKARRPGIRRPASRPIKTPRPLRNAASQCGRRSCASATVSAAGRSWKAYAYGA